jgi:hypothetical protein
MSAHSTKSRRRHPQPTTYGRQTFDIAHVQVEVIDHPENGVTFGLRTKYGPDNRPNLFSGHTEPGMGTQLRRLAHHLDALEERQRQDAKDTQR